MRRRAVPGRNDDEGLGLIAALRRRKRRPDAALLGHLVEEDDDGVAITDRAGVVVYANSAYLELAGGARNGFLPGIDRLFGSPEAGPAVFRLARAARDGERLDEVLPRVTGAGGAGWFRVAVRPLGAVPDLAVWRIGAVTEEPPPAFPAQCEAVSEPAAAAPDDPPSQPKTPEPRETPEDAPKAPVADRASSNNAPSAAPIPDEVMEEEEKATEAAAVATPEADRRAGAPRRAGERLARFFDNAPVGIVIVRPDGIVEGANAAFRTMAEPAPAIGGQLLDGVAEDDRAEVAARIREAATGRSARPLVEIRLTGPDERFAQLYVSRVEEGPEPSIVLYFIDTTEQKNLELQFAQSQKMQAVGQLAGGIAHDFNNLLTAILGFCDLLLVRHRPGDPSFGDVMQIKQNANRAANLVRQLLAFSRKQTLRPKVLVLTDELSELSSLLRRLLGERIELRVLHGRNLYPVRVDQGQFEQVIINLAVNARDAMPDGGTLTIRTANVPIAEARKLGHSLMPPAEYVLIEISDTGTGIPKEHLGKIFEPFFTTKEVGKGTGLGLSTVYGIVKQTGGFIFPDSDSGRGATFRIYLPRYEPAAEAIGQPGTEERETPSDLSGKGTLLLVEDEDAVRAFAARALANRGYTVLEAGDGVKGLEIVQQHAGPIDLVITDVVMPNMDGPALLQEIRNHRPDIRIVFMSGYAEEAFRKSMQRDEGFTFLPKPFSLKQLASTVKEALSQD
jgi:two-component system cell cycle sensor histidine kinase/response regulator CckA